jgi:putative membrane protein
MKSVLMLSAAVIAGSLALGACSRESEPAQMLASAAAPAPQIDPANYVQTAAMSDLFEIEAGKLATRRARSSEVRNFARMMVRDHTESTRKIRNAAMASGLSVKPPTTLDPEHQDKLTALRSAARSDFDRQYMEGQVEGHRQALQLQQSYSESGGDPNLKSVASELVPIVQHHLDEAQTILSNLR